MGRSRWSCERTGVTNASVSEHWQRVWQAKADDSVSWYERQPSTSLRLIEATSPRGGRVVDVGGGASRLVDALVAFGLRPAVLDVAERALDIAKSRLGPAVGSVEWFCSDVRTWDPPHEYDVWHDRAVFHFLIDEASRYAYRATLLRALAPHGQVLLATFALDGPETCSGLPVRRCSTEMIARDLGDAFELRRSFREVHRTPLGNEQAFLWTRWRKKS